MVLVVLVASAALLVEVGGRSGSTVTAAEAAEVPEMAEMAEMVEMVEQTEAAPSLSTLRPRVGSVRVKANPLLRLRGRPRRVAVVPVALRAVLGRGKMRLASLMVWLSSQSSSAGAAALALRPLRLVPVPPATWCRCCR